jgi:hypothetical protein
VQELLLGNTEMAVCQAVWKLNFLCELPGKLIPSTEISKFN